MDEDRKSCSSESDALLPGTGYAPDYGIDQSLETSGGLEASEKTPCPSVVQSAMESPRNERVWAVVMCSLIACLASLVNGLMLSFSSATLDKLNSTTDSIHHISNGSKEASLLGVSLD